MKSLRLEQRSFWNLVEPFIWNYIIDNKLDGDDKDKDEEEEDSVDNDDNATTRLRVGGL